MGGGIYIALGVVIAVAAQWAWLSFVLAGVIAVTTAYSYARLSNHFGKSGGAFEFLEELDRRDWAGSLSWLLLIGYVLTVALYAYAFGHYVAYAFGGGPWMIRGLALGGMAVLVALNLGGLGKMTKVEIVIVTANLVVLVVLAVLGLMHWQPAELLAGIEPRGIWAAAVGAAAIFVSYEGFQLLTYEYDEIERPEKIFTPTLLSAAVCVVAIYVAVTLGATMLAGALTIVEEKQIALSVAAEEVAGPWGLVVMTVAAAFATSAAINSTLFSTSKLAERVADDGELPAWFSHQNDRGVPDRAIVLFGVVAAVLSVTGSLSALVEAASLAFLVAFLTVNAVCVREHPKTPVIPLVGMAVGGAVALVLVVRLAIAAPVSLGILILLSLVALFGRPTILPKFDTHGGESPS